MKRDIIGCCETIDVQLYIDCCRKLATLGDAYFAEPGLIDLSSLWNRSKVELANQITVNHVPSITFKIQNFGRVLKI